MTIWYTTTSNSLGMSEPRRYITCTSKPGMGKKPGKEGDALFFSLELGVQFYILEFRSVSFRDKTGKPVLIRPVGVFPISERSLPF